MLVLTIVPSGSVDPAVEAVTVTGAVPDEDVTDSFAIGGWFGRGAAVTDTVVLVDDFKPPLSVTVAVTV
jgi:hypothetical protein